MWCFLLLLVPIVATLPPYECNDGTTGQTSLTLTNAESSSEISSCSFTQNFKNVAYFEIQRYYTSKEQRYRQARDSILAIDVKTSSGDNFGLQIHNDRIETTKTYQDGNIKRCFGIFKQQENWFLRLRLHSFLDIQKTVVSIATGKTTFKDCVQFEVGSHNDYFQISVHASTTTGMTQTIHGIVQTERHQDTNIDILRLQQDIQRLQQDVQDLESTTSENRNLYLTHKEVSEEKDEQIHKQFKKHTSKTTNKLQNQSYISYTLFVFAVILVSMTVAYLKHYIRKKDRIC